MNTNIGLLDWLIFIVYITIVLGMGIWFSRFQNTNEDYFLGGRKMNWIVVGTSLFATAFSSISFVMLPREAAYADYHLFSTILFIPLIITPILWYLFVPLFLRLKITSVYEYLGIRFNDKMRKLGTVLFGGYAIGMMGSMLYAVGIIVQATFGLNHLQFLLVLIGIGTFATIYTTLGGYEAVVWTDLLQSITLAGGMVVVLFIIINMIPGNLSSIIKFAGEHDKFQMLNMHFELTKQSNFWASAGFALFMYLPGYTVAQTTVQRYLSMKNVKQARRTLLLNAIATPVISLIFFFVGTLLFVFYSQQDGFPTIPNQDQILPYFLANEMPISGLTGLLIAGLFAAGMSTFDSGINSMTTVIVKDWIPDFEEEYSVSLSRKITFILGIIVIITSLFVPLIGRYVIDMISKFAGTFLGLLLGIFLLGMFTRVANTAGALIGLIAGGIALVLVWTQTAIPHWYYGVFTIGVTFIIGWVASHFFTPPTTEQLNGYFIQGGVNED